jgi:hypothetical protein
VRDDLIVLSDRHKPISGISSKIHEVIRYDLKPSKRRTTLKNLVEVFMTESRTTTKSPEIKVLHGLTTKKRSCPGYTTSDTKVERYLQGSFEDTPRSLSV